jgi:hypothetical protein
VCTHALLDPCRIEELIRQKNIEENYLNAHDEHPEVRQGRARRKGRYFCVRL